MRAVLLLLVLLAPVIAPVVAQAEPDADTTACNAAIASAERRVAMPKRVMGTIALVESGRPVGRRVVPWPWSINVGGTSHYYASKAEAIEAVRSFTAAGQRSIDVGCMQINLLAHPTAFDSLDTAFEPAANADYAAHFLRALMEQSGHLATAMTAYHSQTPELANDYARRLLAVWPEAAQFGLKAAPPAAPSPTPPLSRINLDTREGVALAVRPALAHSALARPALAGVARAPATPALSIRGSAWPH